ncbi:MAG: hypothetical protein JWN59_902 [Sphingomonas bacterium]|nr:hypothetical protein [Sphingomonas bacterium]
MAKRSLACLSALVLACSASASAAAGFSCIVDSAVNSSTGDKLPLPAGPIHHPAADLTRDGDAFVRHESIVEPDAHTTTTHRIDAASGRLESVSLQKRNDVGEEYVIRSSGRCLPVAGSDTPARSAR